MSSSELTVITDEQWLLVKRTLMDTDKVFFSDDEFKLFVNQAKRTGLDPFTRQIYATKVQGKMAVQATIDGLRVIAQRSGSYEGQTRPTWFDEEGKEYKVWPMSKGLPYACEVGVYKTGFREPLYAMAIFDEYAARTKDFKTGDIKLGFMWQKMPALMIAKVAEALALRRAFPNDMSGIYSSEEIQADVIDAPTATAQIIATPPPVQEIKENPMIDKPKPQRVPTPQVATYKPAPITRDQAEQIKTQGMAGGHNMEQINFIVYSVSGKLRWSEINTDEFKQIIDKLKEGQK